jgi:mono/diheme cytochrome c family protein/plastocyanin
MVVVEAGSDRLSERENSRTDTMTRLRQIITRCVLIITGVATLGLFEQSDAAEQPVKEFTMVVQEKTIQLLDDPKKEVTVWAYGLEGQEATVPGPVIRVQVGDLVRVHFKNTHRLPHTIHFHGMHPFNMDGNGQRALGKEQVQLPGESYTYEFVARDPGYYLYHCHFNTAVHMDHGMYGLFIVEDPAWPHVDRELITFWDEWDLDGDGKDDAHTINTRSAPDYAPFEIATGQKVRLILANIGWVLHTPHLHGHTWTLVDPGNLREMLSSNPNGVVSIGPAEVKVVEFMPRREGTWLFHCHVVPHVADDDTYPRGMLTILKVRKADGLTAALGEPLTPSDQPVARMEEKTPETVDMKMVASLAGNPDRGFDVYDSKCKSCHAPFARGEYGPKLAGNPILHQPERFWTTVLNGRGANMPAWRDVLSPQQIADVHAWIKTVR